MDAQSKIYIISVCGQLNSFNKVAVIMYKQNSKGVCQFVVHNNIILQILKLMIVLTTTGTRNAFTFIIKERLC